MVKSTHIYHLALPGLSSVLEGHIVSDLTVASLIGIRILSKAGCVVVFTDMACYVMYNSKVISTGCKGPSTDLWVLPITPNAITSQEKLQTTPGSDSVSPQDNKILTAVSILDIPQPPINS